MAGWFTEHDAAQLAARLHATQADKTGAPYIGHPMRVAATVKSAGGTPEQRIAAWLHDVVEDCGVSLLDLQNLGVPGGAVQLVNAMTHREGESTSDYLERLMRTPGARLIKAADLHDNWDPARLAALDAATRARLMRKYASALLVLAEGETE